MKKKKYYLIYFVSFLIISFIWIGPKTQTHEIEFELSTRDGIVLYGISQETEEPEKKFWKFLGNTNEIITFVVGGVNIYFIIKHIKDYLKKKRGKDVDLPKRPTRFGKLLKRLFTFH